MLRTGYNKDLFGRIMGFVLKDWHPSLSYTALENLMQFKKKRGGGGGKDTGENLTLH